MRRFIVRRAVFSLVAAGLVVLIGGPGTGQEPPPDPMTKLDPVLQRLAVLGGAGPISVLVGLQPGAPLPVIAGVTFDSHCGEVCTAQLTQADLPALAAHADVVRAEHAVVGSYLNDVSTGSMIGFRGDATSGADVYLRMLDILKSD